MISGWSQSEVFCRARVAGKCKSVTQQSLTLVRDVVRTGGGRCWGGVVLAVAAAASEGVGTFMLPSFLRMAGALDPQGTGASLRMVGHAVNLETILLGYVLLVAVVGGLLYVHALVSTSLMLRYGRALRMRVHAAVMSMRWAAVIRYRSADFTHAMTLEVGQCSFAVRLFLGLLAHMIYVPVLLSAAVALSLSFTLVVLALFVGLAVVMLPLVRRAHGLAEGAVHANRALHAEVADELAGLRSLKILRAEALRGQVFQSRVERQVSLQFSQAAAMAGASQVQRFLIAGVVAFGVWAGRSMLDVSVPELLALVLLYGRTMMVASRLQEQWRQIMRILPTHAALECLLEECRAEAEPVAAVEAPSLQRELRLSGVSYRLQDGAAAILSDIDVRIPAFSVTALVGPSGAGKSMLADLVMGLIEPSVGSVSIDGRELDGGLRMAWRSRVGYVPQEAFLFHDTLRANLLLARPDARDADLWRVLTLAAADGFVRALPGGLDARLGDRGGSLSGGERQRIVLSRALLSEPDLLILDEATSALDVSMERQILETLSTLRGRMTVLLITHRDAALVHADHVIRLEAGRVISGPNNRESDDGAA
ncbi:MAG: ABC transporter ATP-binding protein [Rhodospirillaceae bacterium]|nr:ABC transporter ATP-binding protein [Rhodospirillaceae bacterium]